MTDEKRAATGKPALPRSPLTLIAAVAGGLLLWAAFPPFDLPWLAWLAPLPWLWLIKRDALPGRRPYVALWVGGLTHWLLMVQGIRLAHPALYAGWLALAAYVGVYAPLFVGLTRVAVHSWRWPLMLAAPIVWTGLELLRGHLLSGFSMGLLSHTQANWPALLQISDLGGAYAVSFVLMLGAAALAEGAFAIWPGILNAALKPAWGRAALAIGGAGLVLLGTLAYGHLRLSEPRPDEAKGALHVALIQGSLDTQLDQPHDERVQQTFTEYVALTRAALEQDPAIQFVVWPESMYPVHDLLGVDLAAAPPGTGLSSEEFREILKARQQDFRRNSQDAAQMLNSTPGKRSQPVWFLAGSTSVEFGAQPPKNYNSALLIDEEGQVVDRYFKVHPVMFGEYIPLGDVFPWIYDLSPLGAGLSVGDGPRIFEVGGLKLCPSICFENTVPHLVRRQVAKLASEGTPCDLLVNDTNDGWFKGSSMLDLHFRCAIYRAIENRKPMLIAANTGFSAWIDGNGVVREKGPRREKKFLIADARPDGRKSLYSRLGDLPAIVCALICLALALHGGWQWRHRAA